jgi:hypothetical protein
MATEAQIAANRLNAQKSTGPRTARGKARSSRNALKHCALARTLLASDPAPNEKSAEFRALCDDFSAELKPVGPFETMLVDQVITAVWRKRRARQAHSAELALNLNATPQPQPNAEAPASQDAARLPYGHILNRILRYESRQDREIFLAMDQLQKYRSRLAFVATAPRTMFFQPTR